MQSYNKNICNVSTYASRRIKMKRSDGLDYVNIIKHAVADYTTNNFKDLKIVNYI